MDDSTPLIDRADRLRQEMIAFIDTLDAAFIDGLHTYDQCKKDIIDARRIVKSDGFFVFHDMKLEGVDSAVRESGLEFTYIATYAGMALAWNKNKEKA